MSYKKNDDRSGEGIADSKPDTPPRFTEALTARLSFFSAVRKLFRRYTNRGKQREAHINCRVTQAERLHIERIANLYGVSTSHLIRDLIFTCGGVTNFTVLADLLEVLLSCYARLPGSAQEIIMERGRRLAWNGQNPWQEPDLNPGQPPAGGELGPRDEPEPLQRIQHMLDQLRRVRNSELRLEAGIWDELTPREQSTVQQVFNRCTRSDYAPVRLASERPPTGDPSHGHPSDGHSSQGQTPDGRPSGARPSPARDSSRSTAPNSTAPNSTSPRGGPSRGGPSNGDTSGADVSATDSPPTDSPSSNPPSEPPSTGQTPGDA